MIREFKIFYLGYVVITLTVQDGRLMVLYDFDPGIGRQQALLAQAQEDSTKLYCLASRLVLEVHEYTT